MASAAAMRGYERGLAVRDAARYLNRWRPGCGMVVEAAERAAARAAAAAWVDAGHLTSRAAHDAAMYRAPAAPSDAPSDMVAA